MSPEAAALIEQLRLVPLEAEGGYFRRTWQANALLPSGQPLGTCIYALQTDDPDSFSALHRLPTDEIWHFYLGDPFELLLFHANGTVTEPVLGRDLAAGEHVQLIITAGTWMGGRVRAGGSFTLFGCTMAPGFTETDYEGADADTLVARWPEYKARIRSLIHEGGPTSMTEKQQVP